MITKEGRILGRSWAAPEGGNQREVPEEVAIVGLHQRELTRGSGPEEVAIVGLHQRELHQRELDSGNRLLTFKQIQIFSATYNKISLYISKRNRDPSFSLHTLTVNIIRLSSSDSMHPIKTSFSIKK